MASDEAAPRALRRIPTWAWVLAVLFLSPSGIFILLGVARAMRWWSAAALAVVSHGFLLLFIKGMSLEAPPPMASYVMLGHTFYVICVGMLQYWIGQRCGLWSAGGRWVWRLGGYVMVVFLSLGTLAVALELLTRHLGIE